MRKRKRRRGKKCRHPCECGWRVNWTKAFRVRAQEMGLWNNIRGELKDLEKRLRDINTRSKALLFLESQPVVAYYPFQGKRYLIRRIYFGRQTARLDLLLEEIFAGYGL